MVLSRDKVIGETSIDVQRMADVARSASNHSSIIKGNGILYTLSSIDRSLQD